MVGIKLVLNDAHTFSECIGAVNRLVEEATIVVRPTHLEIVSIDPANIAMSILRMESSEFSEYDVPEETKFAIKLSSLKQVLNRKEKDGMVSLGVDNNRLTIVLSGRTRKEYVLPLLDLDEKEQKLPNLTFDAEITMECAELRDAVADVSIFSKSCEFKIADKRFIISAAEDTTKAISETKAVVNETKAGAKSKFSLEYLDKMLNVKLSKDVRISMGKDYPLKISYANDKRTASLSFILAPRIETE